MQEELNQQMREDFEAFKQRNSVTGGDSLLWRMWSDGYVAAWNRRTPVSGEVAEGVEVDRNAASPAAPAGQHEATIAADAFALGWGSALSDAAFYVVGHCGDGDHHAEAILELRAPVFKFRGEVTSVPAQAGIDHACPIDTPYGPAVCFDCMLADEADHAKPESAPAQVIFMNGHGYELCGFDRALSSEQVEAIFKGALPESIPGWLYSVPHSEWLPVPSGQQAGGAEDWQLVPKELTPEMKKAGIDDYELASTVGMPEYSLDDAIELAWNAMLAAAPKVAPADEIREKRDDR